MRVSGGDGASVNVHERAVRGLGGVVRPEQIPRTQAHGVLSFRMAEVPIELCRQVIGVAGAKMETGEAILDNAGEAAEGTGDDRKAHCIRFQDGHGHAFETDGGENQTGGFPH